MLSLNRLMCGATLIGLGMIGSFGTANAQVLNGTFAFTNIGTITANSPDITTATTLTVAGLQLITSTQSNTYQGKPNDFAVGTYAVTPGVTQLLLGGSAANDVFNINGPLFTPGFTFVDGGQTFTYTSTSILWTISPAAGSVSFDSFGQLTSSPGTTNQISELSGTFTQSGVGGGAIAGSFSFSTPPASVPEPSSIAMLIGMGVSGSAFVLRRRRNTK